MEESVEKSKTNGSKQHVRANDCYFPNKPALQAVGPDPTSDTTEQSEYLAL